MLMLASREFRRSFDAKDMGDAALPPMAPIISNALNSVLKKRLQSPGA